MTNCLIKHRLLSSGMLVSVALSSAAFAQESADAPSGDIVVTARRVEERLQDVPISITVFSQQDLANRNVVSASDLAIYTPSLTSNNRFGSDKSSFTLRGFSQDGKTAPTVALYFADVVSIRSNSGTGGSNGTGPGAFFDLQSIQVLKGPQGTLFGRNTTGGAILLVPQKPTDRLEGYVEGSIGNYDMRRIQAVINLPLAETFRVRLGVDRQKRDGYLRNQSGVGPKDFGDSNYIAARLSIVGDLTDNLENYTIASYSKSDTNGTLFRMAGCKRSGLTGRQVFAAPLACAQIDRQTARGDGFYDVENFTANPYNITEQWQVINTTTWLASDTLTIKNITSYGEYRERVNGSIGGENWYLLSGPQTGLPFSNVTIDHFPNQYSNIQNAFTEEFQLQGRSLNNSLIWQAGAYLELSNPMKLGDTTFSESLLNCSDVAAFRCIAPPAPFTTISGLGVIYNQIKNRNIGLYAQGTYNFSEKFAVTAGVRYTIDKMSGHGGRLQLSFAQPNTVTSIACSNPRLIPPAGTRDPTYCDSGLIEKKSEKPTWVIDAEYKPTPDLMVYAKYSRGYRQGGVDPSIIGLETWEPEKIDTYEIGAKTSFSGALRGYFNIAAFYNDFSNQQLAAATAGRAGTGISGARIIINAGKSRIWGIEADASISPAEGLKLDAGYAYLNTKLQEFVVPTLPATSPYVPPPSPQVGGDLLLSPHHRLTATVSYKLPLDESIGNISLGATYVYTSKQLALDLAQSPFGQMPSSSLVNLNVNWNSVGGSPIDLAFFVTNLTKKEFPVNSTANWTSLGYEAYVTNVPRMYGLRLKYSFGE